MITAKVRHTSKTIIIEAEDMQGDIYQLDLLMATNEESNVPKPVVAQSDDNMAETTGFKPTSDSEVAIYNEDDLSHLLYINNNTNNHSGPHHHHHHHLRAAHKKPQNLILHPYSAPITILTGATNPELDMNMMDTGAESDVSSGSDCASFSGAEYGWDAENSHPGAVPVPVPDTPLTPPLPFLPLLSMQHLEEAEEEEAEGDGDLAAYRRKGRRNALSISSLDEVFDVPVFLGRQAEEEQEQEQERPQPRSQEGGKKEGVHPAGNSQSQPQHQIQVVDNNSISGPLMSWWPALLETMENDWSEEEMEWVRETEKEKEMRLADQIQS